MDRDRAGVFANSSLYWAWADAASRVVDASQPMYAAVTATSPMPNVKSEIFMAKDAL